MVTEESQKRLRELAAIVESSDDAIYGWSREGRITSWNAGAERLYGYTAGEINGKAISLLIPRERAGEEQMLIRKFLANERVDHFETQRQRKDGSIVDVSLTVSPIRDGDGVVRGAAAIARDISDRKRAEDALRQQSRELAHQANLLELSREAILVRDRESRIVFWNRGAEEMYGWSRDEARHRVTHELLQTVFPESLEAIEDELRRKGRWEGELVHARRDGTAIVVESRQVMQVNDDWMPVGILEINSDITAQKREERARRDLDEHIRLLLATTDEGMYGVDVQGRCTFVNQAAKRMLGFSAGELVGQKVHDLTHHTRPDGSSYPIEECRIYRAFTTGVGGSVEGEVFWRKDGTSFWVEYSSHPIRAEEAITGAVVTFRDVTERRAMERDLARHAAELARSNAELEQFAYIASHDLQEPLRMVASYVQLLQRRYVGKLDAEADEFIAYAADGAARMQRMIEDLLEYSRVGRKAKPMETVDCDAVVNEALGNLRRAIEESGAKVSREPMPIVRGDPSQLVRLFQNLIGNAIKFRNGRAPEVRLHAAAEDDDSWRISVRDNGIGIDPGYSDRIFAIFQRLHGRDRYPGTGIGLAICKKIVERHGGRIWVESRPGDGSTFHVTLPSAEGART